MSKWIRRLFCHHSWSKHNEIQYYYIEFWVCTKCGKWKNNLSPHERNVT